MPADFSTTGQPSGPGAAPELRASDADREQVVDILRVAAGGGRLTADELDERLEAALASRTLGELAVLTTDLVAGLGRTDVATAQADDVIRIEQRGGSVRRTDRWVVPRRLQLKPSWCDVTLDFTDAVITHDTLRIDMNMRGGSLNLVAGPGIVVDADYLAVRYTDVNIRPSGEPGTPVTLQVQLAGRMRYGGSRRGSRGGHPGSEAVTAVFCRRQPVGAPEQPTEVRRVRKAHFAAVLLSCRPVHRAG